MKHVMLGLAAMTAGLWALPAVAADNAMQVCGAKYQAAKKSNTLPAGQTWPQFLSQCRASLPRSAAATPAAKPTPVAKPTSVAARAPTAAGAPVSAGVGARPVAVAHPSTTTVAPPKAPGTQSAAMMAMHDRQRQCGAQWKADKAAGKIPAGQTWPQYWSACSRRLKG
jgi:hypothetical protein